MVFQPCSWSSQSINHLYETLLHGVNSRLVYSCGSKRKKNVFCNSALTIYANVNDYFTTEANDNNTRQGSQGVRYAAMLTFPLSETAAFAFLKWRLYFIQ